ncbi:MAG TPA: sulfopyruvate decarboxylase subunit beta [Methanotrichaceae archaeon]|nr:sulfopyruvate decarboxylase subunit beta [Methanotrichaceae archaeon]HQI91528.1 sulfopyruvate decarboxylase subunit beta [Methanotrichaceae archaeon]
MEVVAGQAVRQKALLVCNIGYPSRELYAVYDRPENFYMLGSMGLASSIGLGLALASGRRVFVIDGDGSVLMNLGTLATIAHHAPSGYLLIILDNCSYGSTGCQLTCTAQKTDLVQMARAAGVEEVGQAATSEELRRSLDRSGVLVVRVEPGNAEVPIIPLSPLQIRDRFTSCLPTRTG